MRRLSLIIPVNRMGHVLLQHRTIDAPRKPDYWAFFGGHIEPGEDPESAVRREFKEELQIELKDLKFFGRYVFTEEDGEVEKYFFTAPLDEDPELLRGLQLEGQGLGYFKYGDLSGLKMHADDTKVLKDLFLEIWA